MIGACWGLSATNFWGFYNTSSAAQENLKGWIDDKKKVAITKGTEAGMPYVKEEAERQLREKMEGRQ